VRNTGTYAVLLALHLLTVAFVIGPLAQAAVLSPRHVRSGNAGALADAARTTRVYAVASLLTVLLGSALIGQAWVGAAYVLWIAAVALTLGVVVPGQRKALAALESGQDAAPYAGRIAAGGGLAMLAWIAIIVLMVAKPGA